MDYREKYIELSYEYDELKAECRHLTDELKEVEEILDNIMPVLKKYLTEGMAELINNKIGCNSES